MRFGDNFASLYGMAANAAGSAKKKAAILGAIAKANVSIYSEEDKIKKAEAELGRLYYNDFIAGSSRSSIGHIWKKWHLLPKKKIFIAPWW